MANRIDATLSGVGTVLDVQTAWSQQLNDPATDVNLKNLSDALAKFAGAGVDIYRASQAMICANFNLAFKDTGQLYQVDDVGHISYRYFSSGAERELILSLMG